MAQTPGAGVALDETTQEESSIQYTAATSVEDGGLESRELLSDDISDIPEVPIDSNQSQQNTAGDTLVGQEKEYKSITGEANHFIPELRLANRVTESQDTKYAVCLLLTIVFTLTLWLSSYAFEAHSHLLPFNSFTTKLFLVFCIILCSVLASTVAAQRKRVTAQWLKYLSVISSALGVVLAVYLFVRGWVLVAMLVVIVVVADVIEFFNLEEDAEFAAIMLQIVDERLETPIKNLARTALGLQVSFLVLWSMFFVDLLQCHMVATRSFTGIIILTLTYALLFWVAGVFRAAVSFVGSGVFTNELIDADLESSKVAQLLIQRIMSTSFGTLCAGSFRLTVASALLSFTKVADAFTTVWKKITKSNSLVFSQSFSQKRHEKVFEFATQYCWPRAALRGCSFATASKLTWYRVNENGLDFAVFGTYTEHIFRYLSATMATTFALIVLAVLHLFDKQEYSPLFVFFVWTTSNVLTNQLFEPWHCCVSSLLICYAEKPQSLNAEYPVLYHRFLRIAEVSEFETRKEREA